MPTIAISGHTPVNDTGGNSAPSTSAISNPTLQYYNASSSVRDPQSLKPDLLTIMRWLASLGQGPIPPVNQSQLNLKAFQSTPIPSDSWYFTPGYSKYII